MPINLDKVCDDESLSFHKLASAKGRFCKNLGKLKFVNSLVGNGDLVIKL